MFSAKNSGCSQTEIKGYDSLLVTLKDVKEDIFLERKRQMVVAGESVALEGESLQAAEEFR